MNCIAPGPVWTPLIPSTLTADHVEHFGKNTPFGRAADPDEIAPSFLFFATDAVQLLLRRGARPSRRRDPPWMKKPTRSDDARDKKHGPSVKNPKQYEGLRGKGMSKQRAAAISNANKNNDNASSRKGGRNSHKSD